MNFFSIIFLLAALFSFTGLEQDRPTTPQLDAPKIPKAVALKFTLLNSPGLSQAGSLWETVYELRIVNEATYYQAIRDGKFKNANLERVGEVINKGSFTRNSFKDLQNREVILQLPLSEDVQARLRNQPKNRIKLAAAPTIENIKISREHEQKGQVFLLYAVVNFYDPALKKNVVVPISRTWMFARYPVAEFEIRLEITETGHKVEST